MSKRNLTIDLDDQSWARIDRLVKADEYVDSVDDFVSRLLDHVQQGIYRSGAWERGWLEQCVGSEAIEAAYSVDEDPAYQSGLIDRDGNFSG